jgi:Fe-S cluster assembly protein SufD
MTNNLQNLFKHHSKLGERFNSLAFPTKKTEEWIYTNPLMLFDGISNLDSKASSKDLSGDILFSNGELVGNNSNLGIKVSEKLLNIPEATLTLQQVAKNYELVIDKNQTAPIFIHQNYETTSNSHLSGSNLIIKVEKNMKAIIVEVISGNNKGLHSGLTKIELEENATLEYVKVLPPELENKYLGSVTTQQKRDSSFNGVIITLGGSISRHHLQANLNEENATGNFHGLFSLDENQHSDTLSHIKHHAPRTYSGQLYKGALNDEARGVFTGKLFIARDAQEVDANQLSKNLLLSPKAHIDTRPQLEVYADDVKAAHGATVGQIGEEEIFYLQSRGIDATAAFKMLCDGFSADVIDHVENEAVRHFLFNELKKKAMKKGDA